MKNKCWAVVHEGEVCFATEEDDSPLALFDSKYGGEVAAKVLAREIGDGAEAQEFEIILQPIGAKRPNPIT